MVEHSTVAVGFWSDVRRCLRVATWATPFTFMVALACATPGHDNSPVNSQLTEGSPRVEDGQVIDADRHPTTPDDGTLPVACSERILVACRRLDGSENVLRCRDGFYDPCGTETCDGVALGPVSVNDTCQVMGVTLAEPARFNLSVQLPDGYYEPRRVGDAAECGSGPGWYWKEGIFLCPASCDRLVGVDDIDLRYGCESIWRQP
jgi:hypothetical protein